MNTWIAIAALLLCAHSIVMAFIVIANPNWYIGRAIAAGVEPNVRRAVTMKLVLAALAGAVGFWLL